MEWRSEEFAPETDVGFSQKGNSKHPPDISVFHLSEEGK